MKMEQRKPRRKGYNSYYISEKYEDRNCAQCAISSLTGEIPAEIHANIVNHLSLAKSKKLHPDEIFCYLDGNKELTKIGRAHV